MRGIAALTARHETLSHPRKKAGANLPALEPIGRHTGNPKGSRENRIRL